MQQRVVFMGTPEFSVPSLEAIAGRFAPEDLLVVTQPDRSAGRGHQVQPPAVKVAAGRLGLDVVQPMSMKRPETREALERFAPDLVIVAAFGLILPRWVLRLPKRGCVNVHASLLPRFRGASPIAAAIACGDARTGVALMEMDAGLDTGGVYAVETVELAADETTESLTATLSRLGAELLDGSVKGLLAGNPEAVPQRGEIVETRKLTKAHGAIDWRQPAEAIERHIRAMWSWPRAWTVGVDELRIQIHDADAVAGGAGAPGAVVGFDGGVLVATGSSVLRLNTVQLPGKVAQPSRELKSHPVFRPGATLGVDTGFQVPEPWIVSGGAV